MKAAMVLFEAVLIASLVGAVVYLGGKYVITAMWTVSQGAR
jgi:hypothetical protein